MSKDRGYRNYSKPSVTAEPIPEDVKEVLTEGCEDPEESITGTVIDCEKLNIRKEPSSNAEVVCAVPRNSMLVIEPSESTSSWFRVFSENGANGYCMKQFVSLSNQ